MALVVTFALPCGRILAWWALVGSAKVIAVVQRRTWQCGSAGEASVFAVVRGWAWRRDVRAC
ncbi:hypothetical protein [Corynebacterium ulceribovis]|uniref:hypothetical protein n=1 Tax=Corynebacterium ulceribovis TaxID=487732 RepID=UPI0003A6CF50|nr:hypothetical protein [Corynebacterium ulceribovis]